MKGEEDKAMSEIICTIYAKGENPPKTLENGQILYHERVFGSWWKLVIRLEKSKIQSVAEELKEHGMTLAQSPHYK